jgi:hypothetical protein
MRIIYNVSYQHTDLFILFESRTVAVELQSWSYKYVFVQDSLSYRFQLRCSCLLQINISTLQSLKLLAYNIS